MRLGAQSTCSRSRLCRRHAGSPDANNASTIVLKTLEKRPEDRYSTNEEFWTLWNSEAGNARAIVEKENPFSEPSKTILACSPADGTRAKPGRACIQGDKAGDSRGCRFDGGGFQQITTLRQMPVVALALRDQ